MMPGKFHKTFAKLALSLALILLLPAAGQAASKIVNDFKPALDSLSTLMHERTGVEQKLSVKQIMKRGNSLDFYFDNSLSDYPLRNEDYSWLRTTLKSLFPDAYKSYSLGEIYSAKEKAADLTVSPINYGGSPIPTEFRRSAPSGGVVVTSDDRPVFSRGMSGRQIALWASHGIYYNQSTSKWTWQRPLLFQTVEDLLSTSFVLPYLVPMLENAGAYVMMPRERDTGTVELIVDNDGGQSSRICGSYSEKGKWTDAGTGFADKKEIYTGEENPFTLGSARKASGSDAKAVWTPDIPERNFYAVYVSYKTVDGSTSKAHYTVRHLGGTSSFTVNQQMAGGTWIYLGTFEFDEGTDGCIELANAADGTITADAVKIGGGMGNIARSLDGDPFSEEETSGMPRYAEAARYWLQWAGIPAEVYSQHENKNDYRDDLFCRGDWVDYLSGGSSINPKKQGQGVPFDLTMAFHSDAGVTPNDSIVGTLVIYTRLNESRKTYPDGEDRATNREFSDFVQSQIVGDLQAGFDPEWQRRQIWNRGYRESRTPPTPTILTESFSHQNFADMRLAQDPNFKFALSRAIYKGMLKYLSSRYGVPYTVQPLPVHSFAALPSSDGDAKVRLSWLPTTDSIELTAVATGYRLYTRINDGAFDGGVAMDWNKSSDGRIYVDVPVTAGNIYSYKITAVNDGGESFPSEVLAVGIPSGSNGFGGQFVTVLNNFTRVSAPAWYDTEEVAGFDNNADSGVPYIRDIAFTGEFYNNRRQMEWESDDNPGFGASYNDHSGYPVAGNTFDFVYKHGKAIMAAGLPFCSTSAEAFAEQWGGGSSYGYGSGSGYGSSSYSSTAAFGSGKTPAAIDIICGKQVTTPLGGKNGQQRYAVFPVSLQNALTSYTSKGGNVLISGTHIGTDVWSTVYPVKIDSLSRESSVKFVKNILGYSWAGGNASRTGSVKAVRIKNANATTSGSDNRTPGVSGSTSQGKPGRFTCNVSATFNTDFSGTIYRVDNPDGLNPAGNKSATIFRYADSNISAGVSYIASDGHRVVSFGFPLETLLSEDDFNAIINSTLTFFGL